MVVIIRPSFGLPVGPWPMHSRISCGPLSLQPHTKRCVPSRQSIPAAGGFFIHDIKVLVVASLALWFGSSKKNETDLVKFLSASTDAYKLKDICSGSKMLQGVSHQIGQSPARIGLSNPTSPSIQSSSTPKLSSQVQQSQQSHQQTNITSTLTTSTALLSLLPPFARAQTLLLQMAVLASRLFEVSSKRSSWFNAFRGSLPTFLSSQTQLVTSPPLESTSSTKEILALFTSLQAQLFEAVTELQEILDLQDAKRKVSREIWSKDSVMRAFANKLKDAERVLDMLVDDYSDYRQPKRLKSDDDEDESSSTTIASRVNLSDILSYAHKISYTTFAPPEFGAGLAPLRGALPPAPQDEQMRASQLYSFADLDIGLPKTMEDKAVESLIEPAFPAPVDPLAIVPGLQDPMPPNLTIPANWKPEMPMDLPTYTTPPPPGLKPGDPITLHPIHVPGRAEEQQTRTAPQPGLHKAPDPIQVRHVQLDIDQDDDSSDYSSSEASSDED